jgi:hypothetical protein
MKDVQMKSSHSTASKYGQSLVIIWLCAWYTKALPCPLQQHGHIRANRNSVICSNSAIPGAEYAQKGPTLVSPSTYIAVAEHPTILRNLNQEKGYQHIHAGCHHVAQHHPTPCGTYCLGHATFHALKGVGQLSIQLSRFIVCCPCVQPYQESGKMAVDSGQTKIWKPQ